jgi:hypothetical protein
VALASLAARLFEKIAQKGLKPCGGSAQCFEQSPKGKTALLGIALNQ